MNRSLSQWGQNQTKHRHPNLMVSGMSHRDKQSEEAGTLPDGRAFWEGPCGGKEFQAGIRKVKAWNQVTEPWSHFPLGRTAWGQSGTPTSLNECSQVRAVPGVEWSLIFPLSTRARRISGHLLVSPQVHPRKQGWQRNWVTIRRAAMLACNCQNFLARTSVLGPGHPDPA